MSEHKDSNMEFEVGLPSWVWDETVWSHKVTNSEMTRHSVMLMSNISTEVLSYLLSSERLVLWGKKIKTKRVDGQSENRGKQVLLQNVRVKRDECGLINRANCRSESGEQVLVYFDAGLSLLERGMWLARSPIYSPIRGWSVTFYALHSHLIHWASERVNYRIGFSDTFKPA